MNDRQRIEAAMEDLRAVGYYTIPSSELPCCSSCGWGEVGEGEAAVFWNVQSDDYSFFADGNGPTFEWEDEDSDEFPEAEYEAARMGQGGVLHHSLHLQWAGDARTIVGVLREKGLTVIQPADGSEAIEVLASNL